MATVECAWFLASFAASPFSSLLQSTKFKLIRDKIGGTKKERRKRQRKGARAGSPFFFVTSSFFLCSSNFPLNSYCDKKQKKEGLRRRLHGSLWLQVYRPGSLDSSPLNSSQRPGIAAWIEDDEATI